MNDEAQAILQSMLGRAITNYHMGEDGLHFELEDGRTVIFAGVFVIGVMEADEQVLH